MTIRYAFWGPALLGLAADLLSKHLAFAFLAATDAHRHPLLGRWLVLHLQRNTGGVFGIFPGKSHVFVVLSLLALGAVGWMVLTSKPEQRLLRVALGLVFAGAIGNLADRLCLGYVRDFIYIEAINYPAFNIADTCICIAAALLLLEIIRDWRKAHGAAPEP